MSRLKKRLPTCAAIFALLALGNPPPVAHELHLRKVVPAGGLPAGMTVGPARCDSAGRVLFVPYASPLQSIVTISPDGGRVARLELGGSESVAKGQISDFAVGPNDEVFVLALVPRLPEGAEAYLVVYDSDGKQRSAARLDIDNLRARQIAVFDTGEVFVSGHRQDDQGRRRAFAAIFSSSGQLLSEVKLSEDLKQPSLAHKGPVAVDERESQYAAQLDTSMAESASGGILLARLTPVGPVFRISAAGKLLHTLRLQPPGEKLELIAVKADGTTLVAEYQGEPPAEGMGPIRIRLFDSNTGAVLRDYHHQDYRIGMSLACYKGEQFVFRSSEEGRVTVAIAEP